MGYVRLNQMSDGRRTHAKVHRHSKLAGRCESGMWTPFNKRDVGRYMRAAELYELNTRPPGARSGVLGTTGLEVLRQLLRTIDFRTGRLEPSIAYLMDKLHRSKAAVVRALKALKFAGFLDWVRRYELTNIVGRGPQKQQITNAYRLSLPPAADKLLGLFGRAPTESEDVAADRAARAAEIKAWSFEHSSLGEAFRRWGGYVRERESTQRDPSGIGLDLRESRA